MEIRNQLTLELITILQPPETIPHLKGSFAYSPDGRSIACASDIAIIIWDIQTGGVAKEIRCSANNMSLVWSSNGGTICTIESKDWATFPIHTYCVSSGTASSPGTLQLECGQRLWTADESFRVMTPGRNRSHAETIDIFKVGSTLTKIQSFPFRWPWSGHGRYFSPTTHHISVSGESTLFISDVQSSECLLRTEGRFDAQRFSSDGSLFAASQGNIVRIWKYGSGRYTLCGRFQFQALRNPSLQFSPTPSSSILSHFKNIIQVLRLHQLPTAPETHRQQYARLSRSGTRVATAHAMESTVTTTDILARTPPQFIDTDAEINGLFLTGNVLLVGGSGQVVAWLLTEEGLVDGVVGDRRVGRGDSIWTIPFSLGWGIGVEGQIGVIRLTNFRPHTPDVDQWAYYHTDTGEFLRPTQELHCIPDAHRNLSLSQNHLHLHNLSQYNAPHEDRWQTSRVTVQEGWVKDAKGRHRLWVPVEWRVDWDPEDWLHDVMIQFSHLGGRPVLIKF